MTVRGARRDLALLLAGALVSTAGSALSIVAVLIHLRPLGSGWVAAAFAAEIVPIVLLAAPAGALVDRVRNRELLVAALAVQAAAILLATTALVPGRQGFLLAALAVVGAGTSVATPTIQALLPRISGEEGATRAFGWWSAVQQGGFLVGAAGAGLLVEAVGVRGALIADGLSYLVLAGAIAFVRTQRHPSREAADAGTAGPAGTGSAWTGVAVLRRDRVLRVAVAGLALVILASIVVNVAEVFYVLEDLGASPAVYGLVTACWPLGGVPAGILAGRLVGERALLAALAAAGVAMGLALVLTGAVVLLGALVVAWLIGGTANAVQNVCLRALVRARVPDRERGRAYAAVAAVLQATNLCGLAAAGAVVALAGARPALAGAGVLTVAAGAGTWLLARPALRDAAGARRPASRDRDGGRGTLA
jgi:MFS family permease